MADPIGKIEAFVDADDNLTIGAFLFQLTNKDIVYAQSSGYWQQLSLTGKAEMIADIVGGRTIGYNPFPSVASYQPTFILSQALNRTSEAGGLLWLASEFGFLSSKWGTRGKKIAIGGAIGGVFDAPASGSMVGAPQSTVSGNPRAYGGGIAANATLQQIIGGV